MSSRVSAETISDAMKVYNAAKVLLDDPVFGHADYWELGQETGLDEKTVNRSVKHLVSQNLISVQNTADGELVTEVKELKRGRC
jgi:predicted transcriptional regulator